MAQYRLVDGDKSIEITQTEFESAKADRDELFKLLEIESWFAEVRLSGFSWQEKMIRFAARQDSEDIDQHLQVQIGCELTSRMSNVLIGTHGLRPHINKDHSDCVLEPACTIAEAIRDSCAHESTRLLNITIGSQDLWLSAPQMQSMPTNGGRKSVVLFMEGEKLEQQSRRAGKRSKLHRAIEELFPDGRIDVVPVLNSHLACINQSMKTYRNKYKDPSVFRSSLLEHHGLIGKPLSALHVKVKRYGWVRRLIR